MFFSKKTAKTTEANKINEENQKKDNVLLSAKEARSNTEKHWKQLELTDILKAIKRASDYGNLKAEFYARTIPDEYIELLTNNGFKVSNEKYYDGTPYSIVEW